MRGEEASAALLERVRMTGDPVAADAAQVRAGNARFTVLTARLLRMEWSSDGVFEDRGTYAFPQRRAEPPPFEVREEGGATVVDTGSLVLRHAPDGRPFHAGNLSVERAEPPAFRWVPGTVDRHNLGGARRTVDRVRGGAALDPGLVSRSGWALFDDSAGVVFAREDGWVEPRPERPDYQDWYLFGHGHDYAGAVGDYTRFGGAIPLVPRFVLGAWWSRYWPYRDAEIRSLVDDFRAHGLPLDVFVIDMDWHTTDSWTGYSWNRELFPDPPGFLAWLHAEGLHTTLNLHPALGVQAFEDAYPAFAAAMGADPAAGEAVPFRIGDRDFVRHYFELLHHPLEEEGVDFWWIDWQQGEASEVRGLDPLPWLNHLHFADMARREGVRPLIFSRWGGLGSHRYPVGFSGDSFSLWPALRFQPHYTSAGANVAYAWWSHDIGGHVGAVDPELYVRWVQFGALSPVLRLHSTNDPDYERLPWKFGDAVLDAARAAFRLRYELVPYLYTAARTASDTGVAPVRPVSWIAPEHDGAYLARGEYLFGDAILAAPVLHPADPDTGLATVDAWLPPGDWLERTTGESFTGPRWVRLVAGLDRVPQFVRPGTALPLAPVAQSTADQPDDHRILEVWPGDGTARLYDDDDVWTTVTVAAPCTVRIAGGVAARRFTVRVRGVARPAAVAFDGAAVAWEHDGATLTVELPGAGELRVDAEPAYGPAHDAAVRAADLRRLAGTDDADAIRAMTPAHPAALARIGGPAVQVLEATAPEDAAAALGHVIVAAAEHGPPVEASVVWTLERGGAVEEHVAGPVTVAGDAAVLEAPFAWDGTLAPLRWAAAVTARWGDVVVEHEHRAEVVCPTIAVWEGAIAGAPDHAAPDWTDWTAGAGSIDFPELTAPAVLSFPDLAPGGPAAGRVARARTTLVVGADRDVAFSYAAGGDVAIAVDGVELDPDPAGTGPVPFYTLRPELRTSAPVALGAGRHEVVFSCREPNGEKARDWYLWASAVDPADGAVLLDVVPA